MQVNVFKCAIALASIAAGTVLMAMGAVSEAVGSNMIVGPVLYILGNGVAAKNGQVSEPVISPSPERIK